MVSKFSWPLSFLYFPASCISSHICISFFFLFLFFFFFFRAAPAAYGSSWARGRIGAAATGLRQSHRNTGSSHTEGLSRSLQQCSLSEVGDQTRILMDTSQVLKLLRQNGISRFFLSRLTSFSFNCGYFRAIKLWLRSSGLGAVVNESD